MGTRPDGGDSASPREDEVSGLHMTDALIAAACETKGTEPFYTRNVRDFEKYEGPMQVVVLD